MTDKTRTSTATYADALEIIAGKLWECHSAERDMVDRIRKGQDVYANQLREHSDRMNVEAMAIAGAVSVLYATDYDTVVDEAYEMMHELYDGVDGE